MSDRAMARDGALCFDVTLARGRDGRSRLAERRVRYPWSLGRGFPDGAGSVTLIPQSAAAGLLPGDALDQRVRVGNAASARLVSAGATTVYASQAGYNAPSETTWRFEIGAGAALVNCAEPFILRGPARLRARQEIMIAETGRLFTWDGVVFNPDCDAAWTSELIVMGSDGAPRLKDVQRAAPGALARHGRIGGGWTAFATIYALAPAHCMKALDTATKMADLASFSGVYAAPSALRGGLGFGVRVAATDGGRLRAACQSIAETVCRALALDFRDPSARRS